MPALRHPLTELWGSSTITGLGTPRERGYANDSKPLASKVTEFAAHSPIALKSTLEGGPASLTFDSIQNQQPR
ncbi:hypothetical protein Poly21_44530 [Allorhodopirellula heiligendammensis]|uniref:Uncharacterized protein n=1 Tax=Allorhodopirellula heiligendammensis TaxID=2714739 RepID=A0A5C6BER8_9BACT|nr:hypothetical protein Poly21_44530 [Allorhodopirellula heiligendammensis]